MSRRRFLRRAMAASAGTVALAVPTLAKSVGPIVLRCQSAWSAKDPFYELGAGLAQKLNAMTGGDLKMEILPFGSVAQPPGLLDSVAKGVIDGAHCTLAHHYHKQSAFGLWGSGPAFGMNANQLLAWHKYGGGKALLEKLYASIDANVVSYLHGPMPTQPLGWFRKPITKAGDFKGLRYRAVGMSAEVFAGMGAVVQELPEEHIVAAMDRASLDGAEYNNATSDRALGLADVSKVCMLQSYHENAEQFELLINRVKFDALPGKLKAIIENAVEAASQDMLWKAFDRYSADYEEMAAKEKVRFLATPAAVLERQLQAFDDVAEKRSGDALFREIQDSQKRFAKRVVAWELATDVDRRMAYKHYFEPKKTPRKTRRK
jgi:TRAP-type mannitol/chloroaromatic compound transport system substrate-binding protein